MEPEYFPCEPTHQKQPTKTSCGQTCVAILLDEFIDDVIDYNFSGKKGKTRGSDLRKALSQSGVYCGPTKRFGFGPLPETCILSFSSLEKRPSGNPVHKHWIVHHNKKIFDPMLNSPRRKTWYFGKHAPTMEMYCTSYFEIYGYCKGFK